MKDGIHGSCAAQGWNCPNQRNKQTNADRIRSMSNEELADILYSFQNLDDKVKFCMNKDSCTDILDGGDVIPDDMCKQCLLEYLQSEVEE